MLRVYEGHSNECDYMLVSENDTVIKRLNDVTYDEAVEKAGKVADILHLTIHICKMEATVT